MGPRLGLQLRVSHYRHGDSFAMGSAPIEPGHGAGEGPVHDVTSLDPFAVGRFFRVGRGRCPRPPTLDATRAALQMGDPSFLERRGVRRSSGLMTSRMVLMATRV